jgi:hypothetical protein
MLHLIAWTEHLNKVDEYFGAGFILASLAIGFLAAIILIAQKIMKNQSEIKNSKSMHIRKVDPYFGIEVDESIFQSISELRCEESVNAARCMVGLFHNGGDFFDGSPMKKYTIPYEIPVRGISHAGLRKQDNTLISTVLDKIQVMKNEERVIYFTEKQPQSLFRSMLIEQNVFAFTIFPLRIGELIVGFLEIHWCKEEAIPQDLSVTFNTIEKYKGLLEVDVNKKHSIYGAVDNNNGWDLVKDILSFRFLKGD